MRHDAQLAAAFANTAYWIDAPSGSFAIRIGEDSPMLDRLLRELGIEPWAYLTAHNPRAVQLAEGDNRRRQERLIAAVIQGEWPFFPGRAVADALDWPVEPSLLVVGISLPDAIALGKSFDQRALLAGQAGKPVALIWLNR